MRTVWTYYDVNPKDGLAIYGGYSTLMVVDQNFCLRIPDSLPLDGAAPLLCAGATIWSPMKRYGMGKSGNRFGVVGLGGLGHMALKFAKAMGMHCTAISRFSTLTSRSASKEKMAREELGADDFINSDDPEQMQAASESLDFIIDTESGERHLYPNIRLLAPHGQLVFVGAPYGKVKLNWLPFLFGDKTIAIGSGCIASQVEIQEMLDFCGEKGIVCTIEKIAMDYINEAFKTLLKQDVKFRFVIHIENTLRPEEKAKDLQP